MGALIILAIFALFVIFFAVKGFLIIQQSETMVIERLGRVALCSAGPER